MGHVLCNRYAALDVYACLLLHTRIGELSDPIFRKNDELHVGDNMRMYTRGGNDCVGEGCIVEHGEETWGSTGVFLVPRRATRGVTHRWAVRLERVHVPRARSLYPDANDPPKTPATAQIGDRLGCVVLMDESRSRKSAATASATMSRGSGVQEKGGGSTTTASAGTASSVGRSGLSHSLGVAGQRGAGGAEGGFSPSEPFFAGQMEGIEVLSSERTAFSSSAADGGDGGEQGGKAGGADDEEDVIDVTGDMSRDEADYMFLKVSVHQRRKHSRL